MHDGKKQVTYRYFYCIITERANTVSCGYKTLPSAVKEGNIDHLLYGTPTARIFISRRSCIDTSARLFCGSFRNCRTSSLRVGGRSIYGSLSDCILFYLTILYQLLKIKQIRMLNNKVTDGEVGKLRKGEMVTPCRLSKTPMRNLRGRKLNESGHTYRTRGIVHPPRHTVYGHAVLEFILFSQNKAVFC